MNRTSLNRTSLWLKALLVTFSDKFWREVESRMWGRLRNQMCGASWGTLHKLSLFVFKYFFFYDFYDDFQCHYWILHFYCPEIICQLQTTKVGLWSSLGHVMRFWAIEINLTWLYVLRKWGILMKTRICKWTNKIQNSFIVHANIMVHQGRLKNIPGKQTKSLKYIFITRIVL